MAATYLSFHGCPDLRPQSILGSSGPHGSKFPFLQEADFSGEPPVPSPSPPQVSEALEPDEPGLVRWCAASASPGAPFKLTESESLFSVFPRGFLRTFRLKEKVVKEPLWARERFESSLGWGGARKSRLRGQMRVSPALTAEPFINPVPFKRVT